MDSSPQAGSSKVTVECTDPSDLFSGVQTLLAKKLPLRNLHWKSPSRPVRSIESLNIDLVLAQRTSHDRTPNDTVSGSVSHRRHQIPGLRQTPYLKIYLLRCDDNETYKTSSRKLLREWIKTHAPTLQSGGAVSNQENHDAFEWLIIHVVQDGDNPEKSGGTSMWPGRGTMSTLEKIKADFNGSSKSAVDRVAQVRVPKPGSTQDSPELADQLDDLIEKMKNAILASFDYRVCQYEEDIREKDSQRSLPGWNFCTFFILKEGLARGFENVGLLEDALIGYDELSVGLDTAIREYISGMGDQHTGTFLAYSKDWKQKVENALQSVSSPLHGNSMNNSDDNNSYGGDRNGIATTLDLKQEHFPLDPNKKPYREMILANNISIFDFRCYLFSRQLALLLRAARAPSAVATVNSAGQNADQKGAKPEDLVVLAEACERATEFISAAARSLRYDLGCGLADGNAEVDGDAKKKKVIDNIVSAWTYTASLQMLSQTATPIFTLPESSLRQARGSVDASIIRENRPDLPARSSSLSVNPTPARSMAQSYSPNLQNPIASRPVSDLRKPVIAFVPKTGNDQLASARGELYQLARRALEEVGRHRGWVETWGDLKLLFNDAEPETAGLEDISLDSDAVPANERTQNATDFGWLMGIDIPALTVSLESKGRFSSLYEELTDQMLRHYVAADRTRSAQIAMADIAVLRFRQADYAAAAPSFHQIAQFFGNSQWAILEGSMLELYARCLKEQERNDEYICVLLKLLGRYAKYTQATSIGSRRNMVQAPASATKCSAELYMGEVLRASQTLQKEFSVPLTDFFGELQVNPEILHYENMDGFQLQLSLRSLLAVDVTINSLKIRLVNANGLQNNEVWLESFVKLVVKSSVTRLLIGSTTTLQGKYFVDRIEMRADNIVFILGSGGHSALLSAFKKAEESEGEARPYIWCYSPPNGLEARMVSPHYISLEELRTVEVELSSGWNMVIKGALRVRPATAGLRLRISEIAIISGELTIIANHDSGSIEFVNFCRDSIVRLRIPYTIDENHTTLSARLEVGYETTHGRFTYSSTSTILSTLPVSVNVQDIFKDDVLFSRFTISPAMLIPLRVLGCNMPSSEFYDVKSSIKNSIALDVFPKQPTSILYKIRQREGKPRTRANVKRSLRLTVEFTCLDEECLMVVRRRFAEAIEQSKFRHLSRLLSPHIVDAFRTQLSTADMETIGLLREVEMLPYESVQWEAIVGSLSEPFQPEIRAWLMQWHQCNPILILPDPDPLVLSKRIVIPVDVPEIQVVHTAEIRLGNLISQNDEQTHAAVGRMIPAELHLHHTRRWCSSQLESDQSYPSLEFTYEIHASPELWLVGGRRRGNFTAKEGETRKFTIMLLPRKAGHLLLPTIEVKTFLTVPTSWQQTMPAQSPSTTLPAALQNARREIPSEVDYRNYAQTVLVLPDLRKTTVVAEPGTPGSGGSWLVDSEPRIKA